MKGADKAAKAARDAHERRVSSYLAQILQIFSALGLDAARVAELVGYDGGCGSAFAFKDYPAARGAVERMFATMRSQMEAVIMRSTAAEWARSNEAQDLIADGVLAARKVSRGDGGHEHLYQRNSDQLKAFQARKINGMSLSRRVWDLSEGHRAGLEAAISTAVEKGMSAVVLSKKVSQYLCDFPRLRADYKRRYGAAADIRDCQYESARLARTEINMAYRAAESLRWRQMDFVVGMEVKLSGSHPARDICDTLKGKYPKDFEWVGWHPNCYLPGARVLTAGGWKPIKDVADDDLVLSLNPDTRMTEWSGIVARQAFEYDGDVVRFSNRSLECRVTADHRMVYVDGCGSIRYSSARRFNAQMGAFAVGGHCDQAAEAYCLEANFQKEVSRYRGMVYDLTLAKNHIMYVEQGGRCYWGSNCICYKVPILSTEDEFFALDGDVPSANIVADVPAAFKEWVAGNRERIAAAEKRGTLPYFVRDNRARVDKILKGKRVKSEAEKEAIRKAWEVRRKKNAETLKRAGYVLKYAAEYPDVDTAALAAHIAAGRAAQAGREAKEVAKAIAAAHKDEVALSALIPDVHQWRKEFSSAELHAVYDAVEKKLQQWSALPLESQAGKLKFEMDWVAKHKKYGTWEVARAAYGKRLAAVEDALEWQGIDAALADAKAFKTASKPYQELVAKLSAAAGAKDKAAAKSLLGEVATKREALEKARVAQLAKKYSNGGQFEADAYSQERKDKALWSVKKDAEGLYDRETADAYFRPFAESNWKLWNENQKDVAYLYTDGSSYVNEPLYKTYYNTKYGLKGEVRDSWKDINTLTDMIDKSMPFTRDVWLNRGATHGEFLGQFGVSLYDFQKSPSKLVGKIGTQKAFTSTSHSKSWGFVDGGGKATKEVVYNIYCPKGTKGIYTEPYSAYGSIGRKWDGKTKGVIKSETEVILQRGTKYRVIKAECKNGQWFIDLEVVEQPPRLPNQP